MKHSSSLAIWLGLGAVFLGLLTTFFSVWASQRKKAADRPEQLGAVEPEQGSRQP